MRGVSITNREAPICSREHAHRLRGIRCRRHVQALTGRVITFVGGIMDFEITTTRAQHRGGPGHQQQQQQQQYLQATTQGKALHIGDGEAPHAGGAGGTFGGDGGAGGDAMGAMRKAPSPEEIAASVYVAGVSPAVNEQTLREFLECCGPLKTLTQTPTGAPPEHGRQYTAVYADAAAAKSALVLNSMTLVDRPITVVSAEQAMKNALSGGGVATGAPAGVPVPELTPEQQQAQWQQQQEHLIQQRQLAMAQQAAMDDPMMLWRRAAEKLPEWFPKGFKRCALFIPIPHLVNCARLSAEAHIEFQKEEQRERERGIPPDLSDVSRTVYAGNVNSSITEDMLADFFSIAGNVTYVKFAGSDFNPSRFGFVEFDCKAAAEAAKALSGTMLAEMTVKVKHSNNPIIKDKLKNVWGTLASDRRRARKKAKKALERRRRRRERSPSSSSSSSTDSEERRRRRKRREERKKRREEEKEKGGAEDPTGKEKEGKEGGSGRSKEGRSGRDASRRDHGSRRDKDGGDRRARDEGQGKESAGGEKREREDDNDARPSDRHPSKSRRRGRGDEGEAAAAAE